MSEYEEIKRRIELKVQLIEVTNKEILALLEKLMELANAD